MASEPIDLRFFGVTGRLSLPVTGTYRLYVNGFANIRESVPHKYEWQGVEGNSFIYREIVNNSDFVGIKYVHNGFEEEDEGDPWEPLDEANFSFLVKNCVALKVQGVLTWIRWEEIEVTELRF